MQNLKGQVKNIITQGSKTTDNIFDISVKNNDETEIVRCRYSGFLPIRVGDLISVKGYKQKLGYQEIFMVQDKPSVFIACSPENIKNCFIKSLKGVGPTRAQRLYNWLKDKIPKTEAGEAKDIENYIDELSGNPISDKFAIGDLTHKETKCLLTWWRKNVSYRKLYLLGLNNKEIRSSHLTADQMYTKCLDNPFTILSIDIQKAADIYELIGKKDTEKHKNCGSIIRRIDSYNKKGWTGVPINIIESIFPQYKDVLDELEEEYGVAEDFGLVYNTYPYMVETRVTKIVNILIEETVKEKIRISQLPEYFEKNNCVKFNEKFTDEQFNAVCGSLSSYISIITGGAGVGKTSVLKEIVENIIDREESYICCSFTGKAVSRLVEVLGDKNCYTIDRLLNLKEEEKNDKIHNVIIDEASMVTTELMYRFFKKYNKLFRLILVGDCNQLPPIGWGSFFSQLFLTERVPIYYLTKTFRVQGIKSKVPELCSGAGEDKENFERAIISNANGLIDPERDLSIPYEFKDGNGFYNVEGDLQTVYTMIEELKKSKVPTEKIAVLTPYNENIKDIVRFHQKIYLEDEPCFEDMHGNFWKRGDPVMQIVNNYNINIMNGEEGKIIEILDEGIKIQFGQEYFFYRYKPFREEVYDEFSTESTNELLVKHVTQSFAKTVHKSQGSEYDYVIFYVPKKKGVFLNKNLLYTAITRAKKRLWLVGDRDTIDSGTMRTLPLRHEKLGERIKSLKKEEENFMNDITTRKIIKAEKNYDVITSDNIYGDEEDNSMWDDVMAAYYS